MGHTTKYRNRQARIAHLRRLQRGDRIERRKHVRDRVRRAQAEAAADEAFYEGQQWTPFELALLEARIE